PILTLTDMENRYLKVSLEQTGALKVKHGLKARINFEGLRNQTFNGEVVSVYSNKDRLLLRIQFDSLPTNILPGMSADVAVVIGEIQDVLLIPVSAISVGEVTLKSGKKIQIQIGVADGAMAQLTSSNLKEGDEVILNASSSH
ncbi:MAG: secretion protein HlyD, partial [Deltaproteobacteria bacterium]|nr:secretion protein HlyD [Deltaproteobacteria bacterium]